jgi:hypothetical protein
MKQILSLAVASCLAGAGGGIAVAVMNLQTRSPRLLTAAIAAAVLGILLGGYLLKRLVAGTAGISSADRARGVGRAA